jgi:protein-tyrosine phosphatase
MEVLFVCSGNIVRSPFAEGLLRRILAQIGVRTVIIGSAGTLGIEGAPADPVAVRLARERGFDLGPHRSRGLQGRDVDRADLIVCMEEHHASSVIELDAGAEPRTRLLSDFEGVRDEGAGDGIDDPVGRAIENYRQCFQRIDRCVTNLAFDLKYRRVG